MAQPGACCGPEIPVIQAKHLQASDQPGLLPSETTACRASQPALTTSLHAQTARTTGGGQASPATGPKASRERRAGGGATMGWPMPAARSESWQYKPSFSCHQARPASCPSETIACRASQPALTASLQARTARPTGGGQASQQQDGRRAKSAGRREARRWPGRKRKAIISSSPL